jgi:tRNA pseudouridine38-40 synthase
MRYRATLAYDGAAYLGFQRQAGDTPTIQRAVEDAIDAVCGQRVTVAGAGRTDSGVHATGQVIAFDVAWGHDDDSLLRALNANLPGDIALQDIRQQEGFHPRFDAVSRVYHYRVMQSPQRQPLWRNLAWHVNRPLDAAAMQQAAERLVGRHDFAAFGQPPQGENTVREIMISRWTRQELDDGLLHIYEVEANAFLQHMVRRIVGALVRVGRGAVGIGEFEQVLRSADLSRVKVMAPPQGLTLFKVRYPDDS